MTVMSERDVLAEGLRELEKSWTPSKRWPPKTWKNCLFA